MDRGGDEEAAAAMAVRGRTQYTRFGGGASPILLGFSGGELGSRRSEATRRSEARGGRKGQKIKDIPRRLSAGGLAVLRFGPSISSLSVSPATDVLFLEGYCSVHATGAVLILSFFLGEDRTILS